MRYLFYFEFYFNQEINLRSLDLKELLSEESQKANPITVYDLVANIVHDGLPKKGTYRVQVFHKGTGTWYELQDLHVIDVLPQMITLSEAYIQVGSLKSIFGLNLVESLF